MWSAYLVGLDRLLELFYEILVLCTNCASAWSR